MMERDQSDSLAEWLATPAAYPHEPKTVEHVQTHISHVFLAGEFAYKLKKPVRYDFLDFSTLEKREQACRDEVRLNRRLAPNIYLDVLPIAREGEAGFKIGGEGEVVDWLVQMRRLPTKLTLESLQLRGELQAKHIDRLSETLARFYGSLAPLPITADEYLARCRAHVIGNRRELLSASHHLPLGSVQQIHGFQLQTLALEPELFKQRVEAGRIVEGHGDLRPEHICFCEPPAIFDCLEFSQDLRTLDVADELAFLAAECDFLGAEWIGPQIFSAWRTAGQDEPPLVLIDFYKSYRACVRAKVAALLADQLAGSERQKSIGEAVSRLTWAERYARPWLKPLVLVVGGLAGTGKSTLALALAEELGAELFRTDVIRQEMFAAETVAGSKYGNAARDQVYQEMFRRAAALLAQRVSVVLDATFSSVGWIEQAHSVLAEPRSVWLAIECVCPAAVAQDRIRNRLAHGRDQSEARPDTHGAQQESWQAWPECLPQVRVDTTRALTEQVAGVLAALRENATGP